MKLRCLLVLGLLCVLGADATKDEAIKKDKDGLQGTWGIIKITMGGKDVDVEKLVGARVVFKDDTVSGKVVRFGKENESTFRLDPTQKTKTIDFLHTDGAFTPGIYKLEENKLQICNAAPKATRPTAFESKAGSGLILFILRREKQ